ncbi:uncharacterized protein TNCV_5043481 [Trichonephila clavipes]|uniref:Uncharacterized protein n=1 Tax=Trichonephila clavipes TaxID=2585209 RepID=A0A8X6R8V8_TRICX|nr:uncharacterized protein TNCV_5043481 [Trichonephila clavipes]
MGCYPPSIHKRYPTTARCGSFCLLRFRPGPVRSSLDDLVVPSSLRCTISTTCLARTPDRHGEAEDRAPNLTPSNSLVLLCSWITRPRHWSRSFFYASRDVSSPRLKFLARNFSTRLKISVIHSRQSITGYSPDAIY